jgi:hypothetical protein
LGRSTRCPIPDRISPIGSGKAAKRIGFAKDCDALALLRGDGDERFDDDLQEIGIGERERIEAARGVPLPCAVLDRSRRNLPIDVSAFGIERFDLGKDDWRGAFHGVTQIGPQTIYPWGDDIKLNGPGDGQLRRLRQQVG